MAAVAERARAVAAFLAGPFAAELASVDVGAAVLATGARTGAGVTSASAAVHASTPLPQLAALRPESAGGQRGAHGLPGIAGGILTTLLPLAATEWTVSAERCTLVGEDAAAVRSDMLASFGVLAGHVDVGDGTAMMVRLRGLMGEGVRAGQAQVVAARAALAASGVRLDPAESLVSFAARVLTGLAGGDLPGDWEGGASSESSDSDSDGEGGGGGEGAPEHDGFARVGGRLGKNAVSIAVALEQRTYCARNKLGPNGAHAAIVELADVCDRLLVPGVGHEIRRFAGSSSGYANNVLFADELVVRAQAVRLGQAPSICLQGDGGLVKMQDIKLHIMPVAAVGCLPLELMSTPLHAPPWAGKHGKLVATAAHNAERESVLAFTPMPKPSKRRAVMSLWIFGANLWLKRNPMDAAAGGQAAARLAFDADRGELRASAMSGLAARQASAKSEQEAFAQQVTLWGSLQAAHVELRRLSRDAHRPELPQVLDAAGLHALDFPTRGDLRGVAAAARQDLASMSPVRKRALDAEVASRKQLRTGVAAKATLFRHPSDQARFAAGETVSVVSPERNARLLRACFGAAADAPSTPPRLAGEAPPLIQLNSSRMWHEHTYADDGT
ncbi:hypothetical protein T492DRAFT_1054861 [Pavlovales sp. CCMP2436]|nr:hypothetical protein T492DRAFT_1054861 [Pavlovales sp. CCMP2436]